mgnify:CR=1 FL=1
MSCTSLRCSNLKTVPQGESRTSDCDGKWDAGLQALSTVCCIVSEGGVKLWATQPSSMHFLLAWVSRHSWV